MYIYSVRSNHAENMKTLWSVDSLLLLLLGAIRKDSFYLVITTIFPNKKLFEFKSKSKVGTNTYQWGGAL